MAIKLYVESSLILLSVINSSMKTKVYLQFALLLYIIPGMAYKKILITKHNALSYIEIYLYLADKIIINE